MKALFLIIGLLSLILGFIGVILPVLPTTPFILLSSACFMKSSKRMDEWVRNHKLFKECFKNKGLNNKSKVMILTWAWLILIIGAIMTPINWVKSLLISIGLIKTLIFTKYVKTIK